MTAELVDIATARANAGHGHVYPRPDGIRARCGGPGMCARCSMDLARKQRDAAPDPSTLADYSPPKYPGGIDDMEF